MNKSIKMQAASSKNRKIRRSQIITFIKPESLSDANHYTLQRTTRP